MGVLLCMCIMVCIYAHISDPCTHTQARCAHTAHRKLLLWTALLEVGIHTCQLHRSCCSWGTTQESSMLGNCSHILKDKYPKILLKPSVEVTRCSLRNSPFPLQIQPSKLKSQFVLCIQLHSISSKPVHAIQTLSVLDMKASAMHSTPSALHSVPLPHKTHPSLQLPAVLLPTHSLHDRSQQNQLHPACLGRP